MKRLVGRCLSNRMSVTDLPKSGGVMAPLGSDRPAVILPEPEYGVTKSIECSIVLEYSHLHTYS